MYWLGVVGSRWRQDREAIEARVAAELARLREAGHARVGVVSGGCRGVDTWAVGVAQRLGVPYAVLTPDLAGLGDGSPRHAWTERYYARNAEIAAMADSLLAFVAPDRKGGTEHTVGCAERLGKPVVLA
jgi:predicted Rossmann fold nucleotide-binding protein DprA/Smf involved in DNA uptake